MAHNRRVTYHGNAVLRNVVQNGSFVVRNCRNAGPDKPYVITILCRGEIFHVPIRRRAKDSYYAVGERKDREPVNSQVFRLLNTSIQRNARNTRNGRKRRNGQNARIEAVSVLALLPLHLFRCLRCVRCVRCVAWKPGLVSASRIGWTVHVARWYYVSS